MRDEQQMKPEDVTPEMRKKGHEALVRKFIERDLLIDNKDAVNALIASGYNTIDSLADYPPTKADLQAVGFNLFHCNKLCKELPRVWQILSKQRKVSTNSDEQEEAISSGPVLSTVVVPAKLHIVKDVDLPDQTNTNFAREIVQVVRLNKTNCHRLWGNDCKPFDLITASYQCDICKRSASMSNPIFTNTRLDKTNLCEMCVVTAFHNGLQPAPGFNPGTVYSLLEICRLNKH